MTTMNPFPRQDHDHLLSAADAVEVRVVALSWENNHFGPPQLVLQLDTLLELEHVAQALDTPDVEHLESRDIGGAGEGIHIERMRLPSGTVVQLFSAR